MAKEGGAEVNLGIAGQAKLRGGHTPLLQRLAGHLKTREKNDRELARYGHGAA
jgi:hypothetical protein